MSLLNRYILGQYLRTLLLAASGFTTVYLLIDFFEKIDLFMEKGKEMGLVFKFFVLNLPFILNQLSPILILLAGVITLGLLNHSHELNALKAGGLPLARITRPIIMGGLITTLFFLALGQWLLPITLTATNNIWFEQVKGSIPKGTVRNGRYYSKGAEGFYSFVRPDPRQFQFTDFSYSTWSEPYQLKELVSAREALWQDDHWILKGGQIQTRTENSYQTTLFTEQRFDLPEGPDHFFIPKYKASEQSPTQLFHEARNQQSPVEAARAWTNFYSRLSYPLLGLPMLLLGLPVLLTTFSKWGRDLSVAIPASCLLAFFAWGAWGGLQTLAQAAYLSPVVAALAIHLLFSGSGLFLLRRADR